MNVQQFDIVVVGAGIAGASAAAWLAGERRVALLERESHPGYHSTGRSAALFSETYGNEVVRALSRASREFFFSPPPGFSEYGLVAPRGALHIAREDQRAALSELLSQADTAGHVESVDARRAQQLCPLIRSGYAIGGIIEPDASDVDVHALHQGYLKRMRQAGGVLVAEAEVTELEQKRGGWQLHTSRGVFESQIVINAAGAWADEVAALAGLPRLGIVPHRRTALLVDAPAGIELARMPLTIDIEESFYFKPDAGKILVSPADETPSAPCDAQPDEMDVAIAVDRVQRATILDIRHVSRKWAGLRSFAPDRSLVVGFDGKADGFFWLAGQGGYGIQTAPAASRLAAALILDDRVPGELAAFGISAEALSPDRFGV